MPKAPLDQSPEDVLNSQLANLVEVASRLGVCRLGIEVHRTFGPSGRGRVTIGCDGSPDTDGVIFHFDRSVPLRPGDLAALIKIDRNRP